MCGIGGVFAKNKFSYGEMLPITIGIGRNGRHRGKDNSGMSSVDLRYATPMISRIRSSYPIDVVFPTTEVKSYKHTNQSLNEHLNHLNGPANLIHMRFTTKGGYEGISNCQPMNYYCEDKNLFALNSDGDNRKLFHYEVIPPKSGNWISIAHNGQVPKEKIDRLIIDAGYECNHNSITSDSGPLAAYILMEATELGLEDAIKSLFENVPGSYSLLGMISIDDEFNAFATKDRYGVRPLSRAEHEINSNEYVAYASENAAFKRLGIRNYSEINAGDADIMQYNDDGLLELETVHIADATPKQCAFEVIYNEAPETDRLFHVRLFDRAYEDVVFGKKTLEEYSQEKLNEEPYIDVANLLGMFPVSKIRERIGELFWKAYGNQVLSHDIICGVPNSGLSYVNGYCRGSNEVPSEVIFINKEKENERSFQNPTGEKSRQAIQEKLLYTSLSDCRGAQDSYNRRVHGTRTEYSVLALDDSSVSGNASREVARMLKTEPKKGGSGAKRVGFGIIAPPVCEACYLGIDQKPDRNIVVSVGKEYGIDNPKQWALNDPDEFELKVAKYIGADSIVFSRLNFMKAIFAEEIWGFECVGGPSCAPHE